MVRTTTISIALILALAGVWLGARWIQHGRASGLDPEAMDETLSTERLAAPRRPDPVGNRTPVPPRSPGDTKQRLPARIRARVLDEHGRPVSDVSVGLHAIDCEGTEDHEAMGYKSRTDTEGRFEFHARIPPCDSIRLTLEGSIHHSMVHRVYGSKDWSDEPPLRAGDNELGDFILRTTGAISGTVRSFGGRPLEGVEVHVYNHWPNSETDTNGRYFVGHLPAGFHDVEVSCEGFLVAGLVSCEVLANQTTTGIDFVLEPAPLVSGRVVDEKGRPLANVWLRSPPFGSASGAEGRTDEDGTFRVYLKHDGPCSFTIEHPGFRPIHYDDGALTLTPGDPPAEVILKRATRTTFVVVSATTGAPIERYGLRIDRHPRFGGGRSSVEGHPIPTRYAPGGAVTLDTIPGEQLYRIQAPGFADQEGDVEHDAADHPQQTIRLLPGSSITGRVILAGKPVRGAEIMVQRASASLSFFMNRGHGVESDETGAFRVDDLAAGTYSARIQCEHGAPLKFDGLKIAAQDTLDLGDVNVPVGVTVRGQVIVASGKEPTGLVVYLDGFITGHQTKVTAEGTFEFRHVAAGDHSLRVRDAAGVVLDVEPFEFQVLEGQGRDLVLDLVANQPCSIRVSVSCNGAPVPDVDVVWRDADRDESGYAGSTSTSGVAGIEYNATTRISLQALSEQGLHLGWTGPFAVDPGGILEAEIEARCGELSIAFPETLVVPEGTCSFVRLTRPGATLRELQWVELRRPAGMVDSFVDWNSKVVINWESRVVPLGRVAAGVYEIRVFVPDGPAGESGRSFEGRTVVPEGDAAVCRLEPE